jgi:2,3-diketo-5-methylthiopentyl-1-phosphate enolase
MLQTKANKDRAYMHAIRQFFTTVDGIDRDDYVIARFRIKTGASQDLRAASMQMALVASIGTVRPLPTETEERRQEVGPRILHPATPGAQSTGEVAVAFPVSLFGGGDILTQLMSVTMFGGEYNYVDEIRLESIDLPRPLLDELPGPEFGVTGIRKTLDVEARPMLAAILKPRLGVTLQVLADAARDALTGGVDVVMDDELVVDPEGEFSFVPRVQALVEAARRATASTGKAKGVIVNVSSRPSRMLRYAEQAAGLGVKGLLFNAFVCGIPALQDLAQGSWGIPVMACNVGSGLLTRATNSTGVANSVYARLSRIAGADAVQTGILAGDAYTTEAWGPSVISLDRPLGKLKSSLPIVAGGLNIANLWRNWRTLGNDVLFAAGSGIMGYPGGPQAGAQAFRKLVDVLNPEMTGSEAAAAIVNLAARKVNGALKEGLEAYGFDPDALEEESLASSVVAQIK